MGAGAARAWVMACPLYHVDAFADRVFRGNPAAVCLLDAPGDPAWMQAVAAELHLSETAFLAPAPGGGHALRWFTPETEVDLCGHATLASAHVLWGEGRAPAGEPIVFKTRSGPLTARRGDTGRIHLDFPATPVTPGPPPDGLVEALGVAVEDCGRTAFDLFAVLADEAVLRGLRPDPGALARLPARGVIVTAPAAGAYDFVTRFFAPAVGVPEDPVTGSAFCALAPYWQARTGRDRFTGYQASPRGGAVWAACRGDRVELAGPAVTVARGEWVG